MFKHHAVKTNTWRQNSIINLGTSGQLYYPVGRDSEGRHSYTCRKSNPWPTTLLTELSRICVHIHHLHTNLLAMYLVLDTDFSAFPITHSSLRKYIHTWWQILLYGIKFLFCINASFGRMRKYRENFCLTADQRLRGLHRDSCPFISTWDSVPDCLGILFLAPRAYPPYFSRCLRAHSCSCIWQMPRQYPISIILNDAARRKRVRTIRDDERAAKRVLGAWH